MSSHVVHDVRLFANYEAQVRRLNISYAKYDSRRFQEVIDELVQFAMRLSRMVTVQKYNYRQRLRIPAVGISDDEANHFAERLFSNLIASRCASFESNRFLSFGQLFDGLIAGFGGQQ